MQSEFENKLLYFAIKNNVSREQLISTKKPAKLKEILKTDALSGDILEFFEKCSEEDLELYLIKFDLFSI